MNTANSLIFLWTPVSFVVGVAMTAAAAVICFAAWRRSGFSRGAGAMEGLRFCVVTLVAVRLNQPEWLVEYRPEEQPTLAVLSDVSRSMQTRDVIDETRPSAPPKTRHESIRPLLSEELWKPVSQELVGMP